MILANKITELRKKAGWSQEELADKLGVSRQAVSKWEGAQSVPDLERIIAMSRLFGVSTDYLLKDGWRARIPPRRRKRITPCAGFPWRKRANTCAWCGRTLSPWRWR